MEPISDLFRSATRSERQAGLLANSIVLTWSVGVSEFLDEISSLKGLPRPPLVHLTSADEYDYTYSLSGKELLDRSGYRRIRSIARLFLKFSPGRRRLFFTDLIKDQYPRNLLHIFFALLREEIAAIAKQPFAALYAPLGTTGIHAGEFRLHADLYHPDVLFNVFNDVAEDGTGASTFLPVEEFVGILARCSSLPRAERDQIERLFRSVSLSDGYEKFIELVHGEANPWRSDLWNLLQRSQESVLMRRGQGYMINDRAWLHGRMEPSRRVTLYRVHRLVYRPAKVRK